VSPSCPALTAGDGLWSDDALTAIGGAALDLLASAGVRVPSPAVRDVLLGAGCAPGDGDRVLIPRAAVDDALAACPRAFREAARNESLDLSIDPDPGPVYVHNTGETAVVLDACSGQPRPSTFADQVAAGRLMHHARHQHSVNPMVSPQDVPGPLVPFYSYLALATETDKVLGGPGISLPAQAAFLLEMATTVLGDATGRGAHALCMYFSPVSPLQLGAEVSDALQIAAEHGAVCQILPAPTAGTTAPAPLAAALAQQHAEVLAGVVAVQAVRPGTPCTYGARLHAGDPRTGNAVWGLPVLGLCAAGATLLARRCGLACDCYGLATDAGVIDAQNGYERALNGLLGALSRPRYLSGVGSLLSVVATGLEQIEIDDEILGSILWSLEERPWDAQALDLAALTQGARAGSFLGVRQTREYVRRDACPSSISRRGAEAEHAPGGVVAAAEERVRAHLAADPVGLPPDVESRLCSIIDQAARALGVGEWPDPRRLLDEARRSIVELL
jgi:trimethylamine--corrinoid protein Co-methyltransferase